VCPHLATLAALKGNVPSAVKDNRATMSASKLKIRLFWAAEGLLLAGAAAAAVLLSHPDEWHPLALVALLLVMALGGEFFTVETSGGILSASLGVMAMAMGLLGPGPAAVCGVAAIGLHSAMARRPPAIWLNNLLAFGVAAFAGGWVVRAAAGDVAGMHSQHLTQSIIFGLIVLGGVIVLLAVNFLLYALADLTKGGSLVRLVRELFLPLLTGELAVGVIAVLLVLAYRSAGLPVLFAAIPVLLIFRQLTVALVRSERRAEQLDARTRQLASFQWAVPSTFMEGLGLRDPTAMRHGAAVASYAKALAVELGCEEEEQEAIHLAGLLHDIGKFTWSDRVLHPTQLTDADWAVIRRHPQDGATMVGKFEGFGPVADGILYHHERMDGGGYPAGLIGSEIPLASRIIAICSTYDTMTTRETYGPPMSPDEATAELRKSAGTQLDAELVETFIALLERNGPAFAKDADYRTELAFENRVRRMAQPRGTPAAAHAAGRLAPRLRRLRQRN
jgi:putative nucleotidyltransferase with HDIG domain